VIFQDDAPSNMKPPRTCDATVQTLSIDDVVRELKAERRARKQKRRPQNGIEDTGLFSACLIMQKQAKNCVTRCFLRIESSFFHCAKRLRLIYAQKTTYRN